MAFKKGQIPWNKNKKGIHLSLNTEFKKGFKHLEKSKIKIGKAAIGNKYSLGLKASPVTRKKLSEVRKREKHYNWQGGITPINIAIRRCFKYKIWRENVFKKDNYTCVLCRARGIILNADHYPIPFSAILNKLIIEQGLENLFEKAMSYKMFWIIDNGRTLCKKCHKTTDTYKGKAKLFKI